MSKVGQFSTMETPIKWRQNKMDASRKTSKIWLTDYQIASFSNLMLGTNAFYIKQFRCCRYSASRRSLQHSRLFKLTDIGTNRKPVCDFLLVNNRLPTHILSRTVCQIYRSIGQIIALERGCVCLTICVLRNLCEDRYTFYIVNKTRFFGLNFCCRQYGSIFNHSDASGPQICQIRIE